jgi:hypothetical protein
MTKAKKEKNLCSAKVFGDGDYRDRTDDLLHAMLGYFYPPLLLGYRCRVKCQYGFGRVNALVV